MHLNTYSAKGFDRGASRFTEFLWLMVSAMLIETWLPGSGWRKLILQLFGAKLGTGVVIKPNLRVKFPWRLSVGDYSWIGQQVWIDNLAEVTIGANACVSQGTYLCTGSHDWKLDSFDLVVAPIDVGQNAWVGAKCTLAPGTKLGEGAILSIGSVAKGNLVAWTIHAGNYAKPVRPRKG